MLIYSANNHTLKTMLRQIEAHYLIFIHLNFFFHVFKLMVIKTKQKKTCFYIKFYGTKGRGRKQSKRTKNNLVGNEK